MWTVDGANNNDVGSNRTILVYPSVEAIEEFKIHRNSYGAEFGQAGGRPDQHRHPRRHERVPRQRVLLRPQRRAQRHELLHREGRAAQGPAQPPRLRLDPRRPDPQGQAALLRVAGVEPRAARHGAHGLRPHRGRARGRLQRALHRGLHDPDPDRSPDRRGRSPATSDPGEPAQPRRPVVPAALSAPQHHAGAGKLQQLGRVR